MSMQKIMCRTIILQVIDNSISYNPDYADKMTIDRMVEERALYIILQLNKQEKELYISYYWKYKIYMRGAFAKCRQKIERHYIMHYY